MKRFAAFALLAVVAFSQAALAQAIAVVNTATVIEEAKESKDVQGRFQAEQQKVVAELNSMRAEIDSLRARQGTVTPGSAQFDELNNQMIELAAKAQVTQQVRGLALQRLQRAETRKLFQKMSEAIAEVAQAKSIDIVLTQVEPQLPTEEEQLSQLTPQQVLQILASRNPQYVNPTLDITNEVIAKMDAKYVSGQ